MALVESLYLKFRNQKLKENFILYSQKKKNSADSLPFFDLAQIRLLIIPYYNFGL